MNLRRILADLIDPRRLGEIAELRDRATRADVQRAATEVVLLRLRMQRRGEIAIYEAMRESAELEARNARADVARLLEDAARCAHEHHTN